MTVKIPLSFSIGKRNITLSMNNYRNWHYHTSNNIKKFFSEYLSFFDFPKFDRISIGYKVFFKDKRKRDLMNFVSIVDKFLLDHLVNINSLEDDNYNYVCKYDYIVFGGYSTHNYIEVSLEDFNER